MRIALRIALTGIALASGPALANERVHADAFGNLVIQSEAGYKRILVGKGDLAKEMAEALDANQPQIVVLGHSAFAVSGRPCKPLIHHGRSAMWGLDRGQAPVIASACQ